MAAMTKVEPAAKPGAAAAVGVRVCESLSGFLAPTDTYEEGYRRGRREGQRPDGRPSGRAAYRAAIVIPDLDAFLADPEHLAALEGIADVSGLASGRALEGASIRLFCRRQGRKRILYELPFRADDGRLYALRGEKRIEDDPGLDVWTDMTTLYTEMVAVDGGDAEVRARGILRVPLSTALGMGFTFRGMGPARPLATARAALRFLLFCRAELNETYRKFLVPW